MKYKLKDMMSFQENTASEYAGYLTLDGEGVSLAGVEKVVIETDLPLLYKHRANGKRQTLSLGILVKEGASFMHKEILTEGRSAPKVYDSVLYSRDEFSCTQGIKNKLEYEWNKKQKQGWHVQEQGSVMFKKGDRVRRVAGSFSGMNTGDIGTVLRCEDNHVTFEEDKYKLYIFDSRQYELVDATKKMPMRCSSWCTSRESIQYPALISPIMKGERVQYDPGKEGLLGRLGYTSQETRLYTFIKNLDIPLDGMLFHPSRYDGTVPQEDRADHLLLYPLRVARLIRIRYIKHIQEK